MIFLFWSPEGFSLHFSFFLYHYAVIRHTDYSEMVLRQSGPWRFDRTHAHWWLRRLDRLDTSYLTRPSILISELPSVYYYFLFFHPYIILIPFSPLSSIFYLPFLPSVSSFFHFYFFFYFGFPGTFLQSMEGERDSFFSFFLPRDKKTMSSSLRDVPTARSISILFECLKNM